MLRSRPLSALVGAGVGVAIFLVLRTITKDFYLAVQSVGSPRWALTWTVVLGIGVGAVALAGARQDPLIAGVPALMLFFLYLPVFIDLTVPSWYPEWLTTRVLVTFSPVPYLIIGVLAVAAVWPWVERSRTRPSQPKSELLTG